MGNWLESTHVVDAESISSGGGTFEGLFVDLHKVMDKHVIHFTVTSGGSPTFTVWLAGSLGPGTPSFVLAEADDTTVVLGEAHELLVLDRPARNVRVFCTVSSGSLVLNAYASSGE